MIYIYIYVYKTLAVVKASSKWMELEILNDYLPIIHLDKQFLGFLNYYNLKL